MVQSVQSCEVVNILNVPLTGVRGGELKVGVGSSVESAEAPVSPRSSAPRPLDFRLGRGMALGKANLSISIELAYFLKVLQTP